MKDAPKMPIDRYINQRMSGSLDLMRDGDHVWVLEDPTAGVIEAAKDTGRSFTVSHEGIKDWFIEAHGKRPNGAFVLTDTGPVGPLMETDDEV